MHLPVRKKLPHTVPQWVPEGSWFFITIKCATAGENQLCRAGIGDAVLAAAAHYHRTLAWHCRLCLLMPDHLHALLAFPREPGMRKTVSDWKKFLARTQGVEWQRDFFDHRPRNQQELDEKTSYILMNPVRKGLCERMEDWPWVYRPNDRQAPNWQGCKVGRAVPSPPRAAGRSHEFRQRRSRATLPCLTSDGAVRTPRPTTTRTS